MWIDCFASGLRLLYINMQFKIPASFKSDQPDWSFGIGFNLKGRSEARFSTCQTPVYIPPNTSGHFIYPETTAVEEIVNASSKVKLCVLFDSKTLMDFAGGDEEAFLPFLEGFRNQIFFSGQAKILPQMRQALNQILTCPYRGKTRALFLEGKAMELMARKLEQIRSETRPLSKPAGVRSIDIERIHYAGELLLQDPINPPDISALAGKVGMSRTKFYKCFRQVYGYSPLDHLRSHRLQVARRLLRQGGHNVTEAGFAVGYSNLSYFSKLFTAEFGIPPHQFSRSAPVLP